MARLLYNGVSSTLGGSGLTNSATSVTFAAALTHSGGTNVPTITGTDYIPLVILDSASHLSEVVWLTAYTAGATTGTIVRGKEGTTGVAHSVGDKVVNSALVADLSMGSRFDNPNDASWGADLGYDLEAETDTTSLPTGWAWLNQGTATYAQAFGAAFITDTGASTVRGIEQNLPSGSSWVAIAKMVMPAKSANFRNGGLYIRDGATGRLTLFSMGHTSGVTGGLSVQIDNWTNATTYSAAALGGAAVIPNLTYLAVRKNSATSWDFLGSADGLSWANLDLARNITSFTATPSKIGFGWSTSDATRLSLHWFRVRATLPA